MVCKILLQANCIGHSIHKLVWNFGIQLRALLSHFKLDHNPLLLHFSKLASLGPKPFSFQSMWVNDDSFITLVDSVWSLLVAGNAMLR